VVAEFSGDRGGVYFEAGFAMGLGLPVVWVVRDDELKKVHFDTNHFNHITWSTVEELRTKLQRRIEATIPRLPKG
jgi:nucleoside 2-deoxyribosyltransferase